MVRLDGRPSVSFPLLSVVLAVTSDHLGPRRVTFGRDVNNEARMNELLVGSRQLQTWR